MEQNFGIQVPRSKLGSQGLEVSRLGFGCGSLSGILNAPLPHEDGVKILKHAFNKGITFFDTSDLYGEKGDNEIMIGKTMHPRFTGDNQEKNKVLYARFARSAAEQGCTPPQLALAWLLNQGDDIVPIPGTTKIKNLESNIGSLALKMTPEELEEIAGAVHVDEVGGEREYAIFSNYVYRVANTPHIK